MTRQVLSVVLAAVLVPSPALSATDFPGPAHLHPTIHYTPDYVSMQGSWHDVAGAFTHNGLHHIFQGTGWNHATSTDLVHWSFAPHGPNAIHETYAGMDSTGDPCSGFVTKDDNGVVCAGFRQCSSHEGVAGAAHAWDVPLELRCATDQTNLTAFTDDPSNAGFNYLFNVSFWRPIPYDPPRPWFETSTGMWYQLLSMDACNVTDAPRDVDGKRCSWGGQLVMWQSPVLRGPDAQWEKVGPVWTDNTTVLRDGFLSKEFVTIDFLGSMPGDPDPTGGTKVFLNNVESNGGGDGCCSGTTSYTIMEQPKGPGTPFVSAGPGQQMVDWGAFTLKADTAFESESSAVASPLDLLTGTGSRGLSMARTLGSEEADQVTQPGRRVLIGWTGPADGPEFGGQGSAQSLPRELTLAPDQSLLQRFVSELEMLRGSHLHLDGADALDGVSAGLQTEAVAFLPGVCGKGSCGLKLLGNEDTGITVELDSAKGLVVVDATSLGNTAVRAGPLPPADTTTGGWTVHAVVDHSIVELIVNNRTAFVVYAAPSNTSLGTAALYNIDGDGGGTLDVWRLKSANNL